MSEQRSGRRSGGAGESPLLLTIPEAAALLRIARNTCYELVQQGKLPAVRLGERIIRIPRFGLEAWLARQAGLPEPPFPVVDSVPHRGAHLSH